MRPGLPTFCAATLLSSCATTGEVDPFAGYHVGQRLRMVAEADVFDCYLRFNGSHERDVCLEPKAHAGESKAPVRPYAGSGRFEVERNYRLLDGDVYRDLIQVRETPEGNSYWVTGYPTLLKAIPE